MNQNIRVPLRAGAVKIGESGPINWSLGDDRYHCLHSYHIW
jgi:hypothetical protein